MLGKLLAVCLGDSLLGISTVSLNDKRIWRIEAALIPGTNVVLFDRWEPPPRRRPRQPQTHHLAYHEAVTAKLQIGSDRTPGCHRLISYTFGGIKMIVKCDVDAALPWEGLNQSEVGSSSIESDTDTEDNSDAKSDITMATATSECRRDIDDDADISEKSDIESQGSDRTIIAGIGGSRFSIMSQADSETASMCSTFDVASSTEADSPIRHKTSSGIKIHLETITHPPHENLVSIKTRRYRKGQSLSDIDHLDSVFQNIYWAQIPNLIIAWNTDGDFSVAPPTYLHLGEGELARLEDIHRPAISKVRALLGWMIRVTRREEQVGFVSDGKLVRAYKMATEPLRLSPEAMEVVKEAGLMNERARSECVV